eukprot:TRINITY_DN25572_c0_g1_i1.p1 TRINITY_DN25572_c0_g1~~TRINITY_DN25572_c0_g1_i1.p1  ORF type:complete len:1488 (+),score=418.74 TRINITY_DN25572_c0_g1_i1:83-4546(+)
MQTTIRRTLKKSSTKSFLRYSACSSSTTHRSFGTSSASHRREQIKDGSHGFLILNDGTSHKGQSFGAPRASSGEIVFSTGMVGYPEALTDPSFRGQILVLTYPLVGNYGVPGRTPDTLGLQKNFESSHIHVSGLVVSEYSKTYSHWNAVQSLGQWLKDENVPGLEGIDTRAITQKIREEGATLAKIVWNKDIPFTDPNLRNLVDDVSVKEPRVYGDGDVKIIAVDCGIKNNIIRCLVEKGATVKVVPWNYDFTREDYDGLFISNGPGDPSMAAITVEHLRASLSKDKPIFGICLGNQLLALAAGAKTYKLKYGNRGQNQPAVDQLTGQAYITPQNHGFAVDQTTLPHNWKPYFVNATDGSNEGIICTDRPFFSVQFHPEAKGGPYDTGFLFDRFLAQVRDTKKNNKAAASFYNKPKKSIEKVLVLGSGGLQIGQAGEFDYSGSQCIKALKEEGIRTVLVNPNIATVQTAEGLADSVYFMPVTPKFIEDIIKKEKPDGILLGFGGQTGLNCGVALEQSGVLKKYGCRVLGTQVKSIIDTEDRDLFAKRLGEINVPIAPSQACDTVEASLAAADKIGYPVIIRVAYALGGLGSGFANNAEELEYLVVKALGSAPQVLVEKDLRGWKEVEYEVVRDCKGNAITVCNMENFDPMGIHTGESIVVAPSQTLSNEEYHFLRSAAIKTVSHVGIVGECNIQYALNPKNEDFIVIEINARLSRSSALASKATGYPLAFVAAKLSIGIELPSIKNSVTKNTTACFEPSLDYIVVKIPRWDVRKFRRVDPRIGPQMKSVGEVMSIGRTFEEALQKALRMVDNNAGFETKKWNTRTNEEIEKELKQPTEARPFALCAAIKKGYTPEQIHDITKIDRWFVDKLFSMVNIENQIRSFAGRSEQVGFEALLGAKQAGFSDAQIGSYLNIPELSARKLRLDKGIVPVSKQIDTLAAEFPARTNYLYMTYSGGKDDISIGRGGVIVLGSGVYRIGSSVEFDYCAVSCVRAMREMGETTIMINYNPETVSTDYDESEKLFFEELSLERVLDIVDREDPKGVVVSVGGQQPNNIAYKLHKLGVPILGTSAQMIDTAEDRHKFSTLMDSIGVDQPAWKELTTLPEAKAFCNKVGYPVLVRPSYVLSGAAMNVVQNEKDLDSYLSAAVDVSPEHPVVVTKFIEGAKEIECDAVANRGTLVNWAVSEHIENAGVHSGDATMILPAITLSKEEQERVRATSEKIAKALQVSGPVNIQYLWKNNELKVIETNLRASRSFPFVSKVLGIDFIKTAAQIFNGVDVPVNPKCYETVPHYGVKAPQFSFQRLHGADPVLGVEMASTGEVACFGNTPEEAFMKSLLSSNFRWPVNKTILITALPDSFVEYVRRLEKLGYTIYATPESAKKLGGVKHTAVNYVEKGQPGFDGSVLQLIEKKKVDMVVNFPTQHEEPQYYVIRRKSVDFQVSLLNNEQIAAMLVRSLEKIPSLDDLPAIAHHEYMNNIRSVANNRQH